MLVVRGGGEGGVYGVGTVKIIYYFAEITFSLNFSPFYLQIATISSLFKLVQNFNHLVSGFASWGRTTTGYRVEY